MHVGSRRGMTQPHCDAMLGAAAWRGQCRQRYPRRRRKGNDARHRYFAPPPFTVQPDHAALFGQRRPARPRPERWRYSWRYHIGTLAMVASSSFHSVTSSLGPSLQTVSSTSPARCRRLRARVDLSTKASRLATRGHHRIVYHRLGAQPWRCLGSAAYSRHGRRWNPSCNALKSFLSYETTRRCHGQGFESFALSRTFFALPPARAVFGRAPLASSAAVSEGA